MMVKSYNVLHHTTETIISIKPVAQKANISRKLLNFIYSKHLLQSTKALL